MHVGPGRTNLSCTESTMNNCKNCLEPEIQPDGIIDLIDGLCDHCREKKEFAAILTKDLIESMDFDYE